MGRKRLYTDEERKLKQREWNAKWRENNPEYQSKYRAEHPDYEKECKSKYIKTPMGRASNLISGYQQSDKKYNRGECTLTAQWIVENIFTKPCHYCGETDWLKIGCDRIDNSLPHTQENVVPCCYECNCKRHTKSYNEFKNYSQS